LAAPFREGAPPSAKPELHPGKIPHARQETPHSPHLVPTHTTAAASSIAHWVAQHHGLEVQQCHLIRRGLNDNYALRLADGTRHVARLYAIRPRGPLNITYETALLAHLQAKGCGVAASVPTADGRTSVELQFPEGPRALVLFQHAEGAIPEAAEDFELTGRALAQIHTAARDYAGPPSRYTLDGHHLAGRTRGWMAAPPSFADAELAATFRELVDSLLRQLAEVEDRLTRVACHGDTHGYNNHIHSEEGGGEKKSVFFDFDDAGPGYLAYDLCVMAWSGMVRKSLKAPDDQLRERWPLYLRGYRAGAEVSEHDLAALPLFVQLRHLWNLGEAIGRVHHWGTSSAPVDWLRKQGEVFAALGEVGVAGVSLAVLGFGELQSSPAFCQWPGAATTALRGPRRFDGQGVPASEGSRGNLEPCLLRPRTLPHHCIADLPPACRQQADSPPARRAVQPGWTESCCCKTGSPRRRRSRAKP
jgi:Ser/Thr protein kinase RdoA (MazF antagonist)